MGDSLASRCAASHLYTTVPVNNDVGSALFDLINHSNALPVVVSLSTPLNNAAPVLVEWGTAARVLGITNPPARSLNHACLISLFARIKPLPLTPTILLRFPPSLQVKYLPANEVPNRETGRCMTSRQACS